MALDIVTAQAALQSGQYDLVILDEINVAWQLGLLQETQLEQLAKLRPQPVELVYTGRGCPPALLQLADLVTEMQEVKHYYHTKGLLAREGIEH